MPPLRSNNYYMLGSSSSGPAGLLAAADRGMQGTCEGAGFLLWHDVDQVFYYIAAGLPVLNNYPEWLAVLTQSNKCGFEVVPEDPAAFADALLGGRGRQDRAKGDGRERRWVGGGGVRLADARRACRGLT